MINRQELEKFAAIYSVERLESFVYSDTDTVDDIKKRYNHNVKISQTLYPELCTLEIVLRNAINTALKSKISKTWLEDEIKHNTSIEYTDAEHGESDELQITFEDSEKLWQGSWIPSKGDCLRAYIGYEAEKLLNCGQFEIDELEYDTPPDVITVKGLANKTQNG